MKPKTLLAVLFAFVPLSALGAEDSTWLPIEINNGWISIPAVIDGREARVTLSSSDKANYISKKFVDTHPRQFGRGASVELRGTESTVLDKVINRLPVTLLGTDINLNAVIPAYLGDRDLQIGLQLLRNVILQIDYPNQRMRMLDRKAIKMRDVSNVRIKYDHFDHPMVNVAMNGNHNDWLLLSISGNTRILLDRAVAADRGWLDGPNVNEEKLGFVGGAERESVDVLSFNLDSLGFGPVTLEDVPVIVPSKEGGLEIGYDRRDLLDSGSKLSSTQWKGILGYDILRHFVVTIDYRGKFMNIALPAE